MNYFNLYCSDDFSQTLDDFARKLFKILGIETYEERDSSNYVDETYFVGHMPDRKVTVALIDEEGIDDLMYWVAMENISDKPYTDQQLNSFVKEKLLPLGFRVAKIENLGKRNMLRIDY